MDRTKRCEVTFNQTKLPDKKSQMYAADILVPLQLRLVKLLNLHLLHYSKSTKNIKKLLIQGGVGASPHQKQPVEVV